MKCIKDKKGTITRVDDKTAVDKVGSGSHIYVSKKEYKGLQKTKTIVSPPKPPTGSIQTEGEL